eukprot:TRINITY_DN27349_c0_g1_i1.p1 TRINITY_DN27349_c0_g1~~TRINITY_DN27349_c0_g1_i1.p1  ORF type:complete len:341 (+),score=69.19 TRINITY_DN27349_c0_g1_i1:45-1067(+)
MAAQQLVMTYEGSRLILPDKVPRKVERPHNKAFLKTIKELAGLSANGGAATPPPWRPARKGGTKWEWQKHGTLYDKWKQMKASDQRLKRVLTERHAVRRILEKKAQAKRHAKPHGAQATRLDPQVQQQLKEMMDSGTVDSNTAANIERTLCKKEVLNETLQEKMERLSKPRKIRTMPWCEGYDEGDICDGGGEVAWMTELRKDYKYDIEQRKKRLAEHEEQQKKEQPPPPPPPPQNTAVSVSTTPADPTAAWVDNVKKYTPLVHPLRPRATTPAPKPATHSNTYRGAHVVHLTGVAEFGAHEALKHEHAPRPPHSTRPQSARTTIRQKIMEMSDKYLSGA